MSAQCSALRGQALFEMRASENNPAKQNCPGVNTLFPRWDSQAFKGLKSFLELDQYPLGWRKLVDIPTTFCEQFGYPHQIVSGETGFYILFHLKQRLASLFYFSHDFSSHELILQSPSLFWIGWDKQRNGLLFVENDMFSMKNKHFDVVHASSSNSLVFFDPYTRTRQLIFGSKQGITPVCAAAVSEGYVVYDLFCQRLVTVDLEGREKRSFALGGRYIRSLKSFGRDNYVFLSGLRNLYHGSEVVEKLFIYESGGVRLLYSHNSSSIIDYSYDILATNGYVFHSSINYFTKIDMEGNVIYRAKIPKIIMREGNSFSSIDVNKGKLYGISLNSTATSGSINEIDCINL